MQAAFLLHRQIRAKVAEGLGIHTTSAMQRRVAVILVDLDPLQSARRRLLHEDIAADIVELAGHLLAIGAQRAGEVHAGVAGTDHFRLLRVAYQANRVARYTEADSDLGANRQPFEVRFKLRAAQVGCLVPTVVAHTVPGQAGADGDARLAVSGRGLHGCLR
ncbi:hypothetical protein D3C79_770310 [compost metagenome]